MRILFLGAGAIGGYFGGRLVQAAAAEEVGFLVRPGRKTQLDRDGLVIESPRAGDFRMPVRTIAAADAAPGWDIVVLTCKAYDLDDAIAAIRPAVDAGTAVLPLLNGMTHLATLDAAFGPGQVLGGLAAIQAVLDGRGVVRHLGSPPSLKFGERDGSLSGRVLALKAAFDQTTIVAEASTDIAGAMWAKLVFLHTVAAATVLMRANVREIAANPGGAAWLARLLDRNAAIAAAEGHPVPAKALEGFHGFFRGAPPSEASMARDLESGGRIEADHILGYLLDAARRHGLPDDMHEAAWLHAKAYETRRAAGRLPAG
ncbi:ketopantoate reductase family protein [Roseomonas sp. CAU 1739]|uniref:ketopantoate reductase family protein n=1 Tax=Roseomonas sp. CAU 1739 TaxID=3140364 RepID=UPI00325BDF57